MAYVTYQEYTAVYGDKAIKEADFNRLLWDATRLMDANTTGIDGYKKLKNAFPTDADDAETVKRCIYKIITILHLVEDVETSATNSHGYVTKEDGTVVGKVVSSVSSGSESISYASGSSANETVYEKAAVDLDFRNTLLINAVREFLSGIRDANGVNLLYMGRYPDV